MKGQIFIVVSILIVISLLGLSIGMDQIVVKESYTQNYFVNVRDEIKNTIDLALLNEEDYKQALDDYIVFSNKVLNKKGIIQKVSYTESKKSLMVDIYLEKEEEYYRDEIVIPTGVYT